MVAKIFSTGEAYVYSLRINFWKLTSESIAAGMSGVQIQCSELVHVAGSLEHCIGQ